MSPESACNRTPQQNEIFGPQNENETHPTSSPPFSGSDQSLSDPQKRMESERAFITIEVIFEPMYPQDRLSNGTFHMAGIICQLVCVVYCCYHLSNLMCKMGWQWINYTITQCFTKQKQKLLSQQDLHGPADKCTAVKFNVYAKSTLCPLSLL